jgi:bifunctional UDP-N-acetylglucosamine pyrophosphorylase/glucosamine-1-phosphate N-acetyltransferase
LAAGVTMVDPDAVYLDDTVELAPDVTLEPGVVLVGATRVGEGATVGAYAHLTDCTVGAGARVDPHTVASARGFPTSAD